MSDHVAAPKFKLAKGAPDVGATSPAPIQRRVAAAPGSSGNGSAAAISSTPLAVQMFADAIGAGLTQMRTTGAAPAPADVHAVAASGMSGAGSAVPHAAAIQKSFGHHDISGVRAHVGGAAAEASAAIGARAYASGDQVAFAAAPDLHLAAHETAHVVQQRGGVRLAGGVGSPGDAYEQHADSVADLVVQGKSAESVLDTMAHRGSSGGSAVQCDVEIADPFTAAAQLRVLIGRASAEETPVIAAALESAMHARAPVVAAPGHSPSVHVAFEFRGEHFGLWIPRDQLTSMSTALTRAELMAPAAPVCEGAAVPHLHVREPGPSLSRVFGEGIGAIAGVAGTEQELSVDLDFPVGVSGAVFSAHVQLRVAHEGAHGSEVGGYVASGSFELGGGYRVPDVIRARIMAGVEFEARGRDPQHTGLLLAFSLQNALHSISPDLANVVFGTGAAHAPAMIEGESADASAAIHAELGAGHAEHGEGAEIELSLGLSRHAHVEGREEGAPEASEYTAFDMQQTLTIGLVSAAFEFHLPTTSGVTEPELNARFTVNTPLAGASVLLASALQTGLALALAAVNHDSVTPDAALRVRNGLTAADSIVTALEGSLASLSHEGEAGIELELELGGPHPQWIVRLANMREVEVAGQEIEYQRLTEIVRGPIGGARHVERPHAPASSSLVCAPEPS